MRYTLSKRLFAGKLAQIVPEGTAGEYSRHTGAISSVRVKLRYVVSTYVARASARARTRARHVKKIPIGPGKSIRSTIWQGNRISNNDATLIIMRLPPYRSASARERWDGWEGGKEEGRHEGRTGMVRERPRVFLVDRNCYRRDSSSAARKIFSRDFPETAVGRLERIIGSRYQCEFSNRIGLCDRTTPRRDYYYY